MLIVICGLKGTGKSVALEILQEKKYVVFNVDKWIYEIYKYGEVGYNLIKHSLGKNFVNDFEVDRRKLNEWIYQAYIPGSFENQNLKKLNTIILPLIQKKLSLLATAKCIIFVEMAIFLNHYYVLHDYCHDVIYIKRDKLIEPNPGSASFYLNKKINPNWNIVENNFDISTFTTNLIKVVDKIIKKHARNQLFITNEIK